MPAWTDKDRRKYEHIKESELDRGRGEDRAEEVAARTVNKARRMEHRTPNKTTQGTGNPHLSLDSRSLVELRNRARELSISGRSKMNKSQLVDAIRRFGRGQ